MMMRRDRETKEDNSFSPISFEFPVEKNENLGIHTRLASSGKRERVVLATFFLFLCDSRLIIVKKAQKNME